MKKPEYTTKDIADFMDITSMGVHYLEKHGAISPTRKENGYRSFSLSDLSNLGVIRQYERMGFSLAQSIELAKLDAKDTATQLKQRKEELLREIENIDFARSQLEVKPVQGPLLRSNTETIKETLAWFPIWDELDDEYPKQELESLKRVDIAWLACMPFMQYCSKLTDIGPIRGNLLFLTKIAQEESLINDYVEVYEKKTWLHFFHSTIGYEDLKAKVDDFISHEKLEVTGDILIAIPHFRNAEFDYVSVYVPID